MDWAAKGLALFTGLVSDEGGSGQSVQPKSDPIFLYQQVICPASTKCEPISSKAVVRRSFQLETSLRCNSLESSALIVASRQYEGLTGVKFLVVQPLTQQQQPVTTRSLPPMLRRKPAPANWFYRRQPPEQRRRCRFCLCRSDSAILSALSTTLCPGVAACFIAESAARHRNHHQAQLSQLQIIDCRSPVYGKATGAYDICVDVVAKPVLAIQCLCWTKATARVKSSIAQLHRAGAVVVGVVDKALI